MLCLDSSRLDFRLTAHEVSYPLSDKHSQMQRLKKGVSVVSSAYVDEDGELVESSFYRSGATLRGVRMTQYFEDDPYDARVLFSDTALNAKSKLSRIGTS